MFIICVFFVFKNNIIIGISCRVFVFFFKFFSFLSNISCFLPVLNHTSILRILRIWLFVLSIGLSSFVCLGFTSRVCVYACKCKYVYVGGVVYSSMGSTRLALCRVYLRPRVSRHSLYLSISSCSCRASTQALKNGDPKQSCLFVWG